MPDRRRSISDELRDALAKVARGTPLRAGIERIVRAKSKIRDARIPYQVPTPAELPERLASVLRVVYLVFIEGYSASSGDSKSGGATKDSAPVEASIAKRAASAPPLIE